MKNTREIKRLDSIIKHFSQEKRNPKYLIKYPYTWTIFFLFGLSGAFHYIYWSEINLTKYVLVQSFAFICGLIQIVALENWQNVACWFFPFKSSFFQDKGIKFGNVIVEDILFIPACGSLFYAFMHLTSNITNFLSHPYIITTAILLFFILEIWIYEKAGKGARHLVVMYTICPIITLILLHSIEYINLKEINFTHLVLSYIFVVLFSSVWEILNSWRGHWIYDQECEALSEHGWILNKKLHIGIFVQYAQSGFVFIYTAWELF